LAIVFNTLQAQSDRWDWDVWTGGKCYRSHDKSTWESEFLWVAGLSLFLITLVMQLTTVGEHLVDSCFKLLDKCCKQVGKRCQAQLRDVSGYIFCLSHPYAMSLRPRMVYVLVLVIEILLLAALTLCLGVLWSFLQFWTIWAYGEGSQAVQLCFYIAFGLWNTWYIIDLKIVNAPLLIGSESSWTFGQVLPIVLLVLVGFTILDAAQKAFDERQP
jgi:hypothetical protein